MRAQYAPTAMALKCWQIARGYKPAAPARRDSTAIIRSPPRGSELGARQMGMAPACVCLWMAAASVQIN